MNTKLSPVEMLRQRQRILTEAANEARLCGWSEESIDVLQEQLWQSMVDIDNAVLAFASETLNEIRAKDMWSEAMCELEAWLEALLGVDVSHIF